MYLVTVQITAFTEDNMKKFGTNIQKLISADLGAKWKNELDDLLVSLDAVVQGNFIGFVNAPTDLTLDESSLSNQVWIINFIGLPADNNPYEQYHGHIVRYNGLGQFTYIKPQNGWKMYNSTTNVEYIYTMHGLDLNDGPEWIESFTYYSRYVNALQPASSTLETLYTTDKLALTEDGGLISKSVTLDDLVTFLNENSTFDASAFTALQNQVANLVSGFCCVTDILPIGTNNVSLKQTDSAGYVLNSCSVSSLNFTVQVFAVTGIQLLQPNVTISYTSAAAPNEITVTPISLTSSSSTTKNLWVGSITITLAEAGDIQIIHEDGYVDTCTINYLDRPVVTDIQFTNTSYPLSAQTQYPAGRSVSVTVTSDVDINYVDVIGDGTTASTASTHNVTNGSTATFNITTTNHTTGDNYPIKLRVRTSTGTFSEIYTSTDFGTGSGDHVRTIKINNTLPTISFGTITYASGFKALKGTETATVVMTTTNITLPTDSVNVISSAPNISAQLTVSAGTVLGDKTVTRLGGGYNITVPNLYGTVYKTSNDTTATASIIVNIANTPQEISVYIPKSGGVNYSRLRSGGSYGSSVPQYPVTISSNQALLNETINNVVYKPVITASAGTFATAPFVATTSANTLWTRQLLIADDVTKGPAVFSELKTYNLAGILVDTITASATSSLSYTIGGFVERVVTFAKYDSPTFNREAHIGTQVIDVSRLRATNLSMSPSHTYDITYNPLVADDTGTSFTYSITAGNQISTIPGTHVYNNNSGNALGNVADDVNKLVKFEIEETE